LDRHIDHHFDEELAALKQQILLMASTVESMVADCFRALAAGSQVLARQIAERDHAVDELEMGIDESCLELLARHQPAAGDLRFITRGLKIVTDLERVGDLATSTASRVLEILAEDQPPFDVMPMAEIVRGMLKDSIDAFVDGDALKAEAVLRQDDAVDELTRRHVAELIDRAVRERDNVRRLFSATSIIRYLERMADHSTNIAEQAIFMVKGRDVRHGRLP
jgi:phosphate transport system protein